MRNHGTGYQSAAVALLMIACGSNSDSNTSTNDVGVSGNSSGGNGGSAGAAAIAGAGTGGTGVGGSSSSGQGGQLSGAGEAGASVDAGASDRAGCAASSYVLCEDFEATADGDVPQGWEKRGELVEVVSDDAHAGQRSLKIGPTSNGQRRIAIDATALGSAHWGRIFFKVQLPVPDAFVHSTLVALFGNGPNRGPSEYRTVDTVKQSAQQGNRHQYLWNVQPQNSGEFGRGGPYDQSFEAKWRCAEYHIDATNQSYALYIDGDEEISFENGPGNYDRSDIPDSFDELRVGWNNYQQAPPGFTAWIDDIAFDGERIGCGK